VTNQVEVDVEELDEQMGVVRRLLRTPILHQRERATVGSLLRLLVSLRSAAGSAPHAR